MNRQRVNRLPYECLPNVSRVKSCTVLQRPAGDFRSYTSRTVSLSDHPLLARLVERVERTGVLLGSGAIGSGGLTKLRAEIAPPLDTDNGSGPARHDDAWPTRRPETDE